MKRYAEIICFYFFFVLCANRIAADTESIYFRWAYLYNDDTTEYKFFFQPLNPCFYYLIRINEQGDIEQLLPDDFYQLLSRKTVYKRFFLPSGKNWFRKAKGDVCYLLVSTSSLKSLEKVLDDYFYFFMLSSKKKDTITIKSEQVLKTLRVLLTRSVLGDSGPVKAESILGVFRDPESLLEQSAEKIEVKELYGCKIIF